MRAERPTKTKLLQVRLSPGDLKKIEDKCSRSTSKKLSEYVRKILLDKPITFYTRNQSLDDFMAEMMALRNELNAIGNNFNQVVKRLHSLQHAEELKVWLLLNESSKQLLLKKVEEIKSKILQINNQWLQ